MPSHRRPRACWGLPAPALAMAGAIAAVLTLTVLPIAGAAASPGTVVVPPFVGASASATNSLRSHGCVVAQQVPAAWYGSNGTGTFRENASGAPCPNSPANGSSSGGTATGGFLVTLPAPGGLNGAHRIVVHWRPGLGFGVHLALGRCHPGNGSWSCSEIVRLSISAVALVHDSTNGTSTSASNQLAWSAEFGVLVRCSPSCRFTNLTVPARAIGPVALFINATFNASHAYTIETTWFAVAEVSFIASHTVLTGAFGRASLNAESPHFADLTRVTIG